MKRNDILQRIKIKWAGLKLSEFDWRAIYEIFQRIMIILCVSIAVCLFVRFDDFREREDRTVYKNVETVNPCALAAYAPIPRNVPPPCVRPAGFFDKFSKLYLAVMVLIISFCLLEILPVYDSTDPKSKRYIIGLFLPLPRSVAIFVIIACWLIGLPLNYFLLNIPFVEYIQLWLFLGISGYIGSYVLLIFYLMIEGFGKRTNRAFSSFNVNLTNLEPKQVILQMGEPLKVINIESKTIYVYKNVKVIFTDGKVSDVQ